MLPSETAQKNFDGEENSPLVGGGEGYQNSAPPPPSFVVHLVLFTIIGVAKKVLQSRQPLCQMSKMDLSSKKNFSSLEGKEEEEEEEERGDLNLRHAGLSWPESPAHKSSLFLRLPTTPQKNAGIETLSANAATKKEDRRERESEVLVGGGNG